MENAIPHPYSDQSSTAGIEHSTALAERVDSDCLSLASHDGLSLQLTRYIASSAAPALERQGVVLLAHGFGQTRHAWHYSAQAMAVQGWEVFSYDARGHGDSGRPADGHYTLDQFIDDFRRVHAHVVQQSGHAPVVVGASMGGLISLLGHGEEPILPYRALVLVDIAPRWEQDGVDRMLGFMQQYAHGFASLAEAQEIVRAYLPQRKNPGGSLRHNLRQHEDGRWYWHWDPRMLDYALKNRDYQERITAATRQAQAPTLLVSGGQTDMLSAEHIEELLHIIPHARHVVVPKAAHMVAGDDNDRFNAAVQAFLHEFTQ